MVCGASWLTSSIRSDNGIALGSAVGGVAYNTVGLDWLGPVGAVFALLAVLTTVLLRMDDRRSHNR